MKQQVAGGEVEGVRPMGQVGFRNKGSMGRGVTRQLGIGIKFSLLLYNGGGRGGE